MIVAAYDKGGTLVGVNTKSVWAEDISASVTISGKKPKHMKIIPLNSLTGMEPTAMRRRWILHHKNNKYGKAVHIS